jgi:hypothetical protein
VTTPEDAREAEKSWTAHGFCTPDEAERRRVAEDAGAQLCVCGHPRREHHRGSCVHSVRRFSPAPFRSECTCTGFEEPEPVRASVTPSSLPSIAGVVDRPSESSPGTRNSHMSSPEPPEAA